MLVAVRFSGNVPAAVGVPESVAVPLRLSTKFIPGGSEPVSPIDGLGKPTVVMVKVDAVLMTKSTALAEVNDGASLTVSVKLCTAFGVTPFEAVKLMLYTPPVPAAGVPESTCVVES